jgi:hypothetical protein
MWHPEELDGWRLLITQQLLATEASLPAEAKAWAKHVRLMIRLSTKQSSATC